MFYDFYLVNNTKMTVKELKKLLKEFNDDDKVFIRFYTSDWLVIIERELELPDCINSSYNWRKRLIVDCTIENEYK